jgi:hypothetical protein
MAVNKSCEQTVAKGSCYGIHAKWMGKGLPMEAKSELNCDRSGVVAGKRRVEL